MIWFLAILFTVAAMHVATTLLKGRGVKENEIRNVHVHLHTERDLNGPFWDLIKRYLELEIAALKEAAQITTSKEEAQTQDTVVCDFAITSSPEDEDEDEDDWGPTSLPMRRDCRRQGRLAKPQKSGLRSGGNKPRYKF